jgi:LytS/YehU family sensor histidine kinase
MLVDSNRQEVPLHEELDFVRDYLAIQAMRFAERLSVIIDVPPQLRATPVPNFILQPLVENAIKHGIAKRAGGGTIRLEAAQHEGMLELRVANDGPNLPADPESTRPGIGIANVRTRLQSLYGDAAALRIADLPRGGVEVLIRLPLRHATSPV